MAAADIGSVSNVKAINCVGKGKEGISSIGGMLARAEMKEGRDVRIMV
jgi:hypothetical protein